jgi:hypothetical protein
MWQKLFTGERQENLFTHSVKKAAAQILFQRAHGMAHGGLREAKFAGCHGETAVPGERNKGTELSAINRIIHV